MILLSAACAEDHEAPPYPGETTVEVECVEVDGGATIAAHVINDGTQYHASVVVTLPGGDTLLAPLPSIGFREWNGSVTLDDEPTCDAIGEATVEVWVAGRGESVRVLW